MRDLDIVLFGATGFVGRLVAGHLAGVSAGLTAADRPLRIALAGRSAQRLAGIRAELGATAADWPLLVADTDDGAALQRLAEQTAVLATTVGPYHRYGLPVAGACARAGTHCVDLTGEVLFARECIDRFDATARATGARIVNSCGFDSVPSDLGVLLVADRARADGAGTLGATTLAVRSLRGGISGGTIDSLRGQIDASRADRALRRLLADPYALSPDRAGEPELGDEPDQLGVRRDAEVGGWTAPFVMAGYNTRIVRRSNALQHWAYGRSMRYREVLATGSGPLAPLVAAGVTAGLGVAVTGLTVRPGRFVLDRLLPAPGKGPSASVRRRGHFRIQVLARTESGARYVSTVAAQGDPGYAATAVMFGQAALALARDADRLPPAAGVLTPATALGSVLIERLRAAGMELSVGPVGLEPTLART